MSDLLILSAPDEPYENHIKLCLESWNNLKTRILPAISRLFQKDIRDVNNAIECTILCHDIGKLSLHWQEYIHKPKGERKHGPPHATLGAPYLSNLCGNNSSDLNDASAIAILLHHTDSGMAQGNLEHPAEDAINRGLVEYGTQNIRWDKGAEDVFKLTLQSFPYFKQNAMPLNSIKLESLEYITKQLRLWARCPKEIERHSEFSRNRYKLVDFRYRQRTATKSR